MNQVPPSLLPWLFCHVFFLIPFFFSPVFTHTRRCFPHEPAYQGGRHPRQPRSFTGQAVSAGGQIGALRLTTAVAARIYSTTATAVSGRFFLFGPVASRRCLGVCSDERIRANGSGSLSQCGGSRWGAPRRVVCVACFEGLGLVDREVEGRPGPQFCRVPIKKIVKR